MTRDETTGELEVAQVALSNDGLAPFPVAPHGTATLIATPNTGTRLLKMLAEDAPTFLTDM